MNIADDLINFDTSFRYELGTKYFKSTVKSISYKSVTIEWEYQHHKIFSSISSTSTTITTFLKYSLDTN